MSRITVKEWKRLESLASDEDLYARLDEISSSAICPALCTEGCEVEPDGECEHGHPSVLLGMGLI